MCIIRSVMSIFHWNIGVVATSISVILSFFSKLSKKCTRTVFRELGRHANQSRPTPLTVDWVDVPIKKMPHRHPQSHLTEAVPQLGFLLPTCGQACVKLRKIKQHKVSVFVCGYGHMRARALRGQRYGSPEAGVTQLRCWELNSGPV